MNLTQNRLLTPPVWPKPLRRGEGPALSSIEEEREERARRGSILTRREFVKVSSVALASAPFLVKAAQSQRYRACVIGHTGRGWYGHGLDLSFQKIPNVSVVGVADPDEKGRLETTRKIGAARAYADYREMLEKERPDLVAICPYYVERRLEMTQAAAEAGAHIYMEKPIAVSLEEADAMVAAAEKHKIRVALPITCDWLRRSCISRSCSTRA